MCVTDNVNCCGLPNRAGEWYYPNGTIVSRSTEGLDFFRTRGSQSVILNRRNDAQSPIGQYCCKVPDASQTTQIICINITSGKYDFLEDKSHSNNSYYFFIIFNLHSMTQIKQLYSRTRKNKRNIFSTLQVT